MEPIYPTGSVVYIKPADSYAIGDPVMYQFESKGDVVNVTHRIIDKTPDGEFITKGDANDVEDGNPVAVEQIQGKVTFCVKHLGFIATHFNNKLFMGLTLGWVLFIDILGKLLRSDD